MTRKLDGTINVTGAQSSPGPGPSGTALAIVVTPHEVVETQRVSPTDRLGAVVTKGSRLASRGAGAARKATAAAAKTTAEATDKAVSATVENATAAANASRSVSKAIGRSAGSAAKASASAVVNLAASATQASAQLGEQAAAAASATFHFVGDLNGDGRCDAEDLLIAKNAVSKVATELGSGALDLAKEAMRHQLVKDAAAAALVGGAVASVVPFVGIPFGAAVGAASVLARGAAGEMISKTASGAAGLANQALKSSSKPKKRSRTKPKP